MRLKCTADSVKVDNDEGRIILVIDTDEGDTLTVNIHGIALEFYAEIQRELRDYAQQGESARAAVSAGIPRHVYLGIPASADEQAEGYALDDPKSPVFHDRMSTVWDSREGK